MASFEHALQRLYQAPLADFLAERKRLAAELRAAGDEAAGAQIAQRPKPVLSVWAVNQLYWQAREAFDAMLAAAARVRAGDHGAAAAHREATAALRKRVVGVLTDAGHAASDTTLRRIATTLAAIAAVGGFAPDPPGALAADRDPPGFEALGLVLPVKGGNLDAPRKRVAPANDDAAQRSRAAEQAEAAERQRLEAERARRRSERSRLQSELREATSQLRERERERAALEKQLHSAERAVAGAQATAQELERRLAELGDPD